MSSSLGRMASRQQSTARKVAVRSFVLSGPSAKLRIRNPARSGGFPKRSKFWPRHKESDTCRPQN
jgi:hypothetical protein